MEPATAESTDGGWCSRSGRRVQPDVRETDWTFLSDGAARGTRTPDPVITNDVLYQLSYCGEPGRARLKAGRERVAT